MNEVALTAREREVYALIVEGYSNKEISYRLGIAEGTVKVHVGSILDKYNLPSRAKIIVQWWRSQGVAAA